MTFYSVILFLHIVAAMGIFVGLGLEWVSTALFRKAAAAADFRAAIGALRSVPILFGSSGALVLLTGGYLAAKIGRASVGWIVPSLAALVIIGALGGAVTGRRLRRIRAVHLEGAGPVPIGLRTLAHDPLLVASLRIRLALALGIVYLMTGKPALVPSLVVLACATLAGLVVSVQTFRRPRTLELEA
ncbi:MAG: hypothetical protein WBF06_02365 [Candidatus Acidiferrales bacterium]